MRTLDSVTRTYSVPLQDNMLIAQRWAEREGASDAVQPCMKRCWIEDKNRGNLSAGWTKKSGCSAFKRLL